MLALTQQLGAVGGQQATCPFVPLQQFAFETQQMALGFVLQQEKPEEQHIATVPAAQQVLVDGQH